MSAIGKHLFAGLILTLALTFAVQAEDKKTNTYTTLPIAVLPFRERGEEVKGLGAQASDLVFAKLAKEPTLWLVDREDLTKSLAEQELSLSGIVDPADAVKIGRITGARILVTGSVFQSDNSLYLVAKVLGTETTRVLGLSAKGTAGDRVETLATQLADDIVKAIKENAAELVPETVDTKDRLKSLKEKLGAGKLPTVSISIREQHVAPLNQQGPRAIDPGAETEIVRFCTETGFPVIDAGQGNQAQAKILITGEAISEFAARRGNLISAKARLEVKAIDRASGKVLAVDRETRVAVDVAEQIAEKTALQEAAADIAERLLPKIAKSR